MRVLVVFAHPVPTSFGAAVHATLLRALEERHEVVDLDLYAMGFDPVMSESEREQYMTRGANTALIAPHLAHLRWAEALVFVYPTWWYSLPAMLKGWLDRVLVPYETFDLRPSLNPVVGLLPNIRLLGGISTYGSPAWWLRWVVGDPGRRIIMRGVKPLCHRRCRTFWLGHYRMDSSTTTSRTRFLGEVTKLASRL
jgi:NAD(P)H dehydrogenase (quinone)